MKYSLQAKFKETFDDVLAQVSDDPECKKEVAGLEGVMEAAFWAGARCTVYALRQMQKESADDTDFVLKFASQNEEWKREYNEAREKAVAEMVASVLVDSFIERVTNGGKPAAEQTAQA